MRKTVSVASALFFLLAIAVPAVAADFEFTGYVETEGEYDLGSGLWTWRADGWSGKIDYQLYLTISESIGSVSAWVCWGFCEAEYLALLDLGLMHAFQNGFSAGLTFSGDDYDYAAGSAAAKAHYFQPMVLDEEADLDFSNHLEYGEWWLAAAYETGAGHVRAYCKIGETPGLRAGGRYTFGAFTVGGGFSYDMDAAALTVLDLSAAWAISERIAVAAEYLEDRGDLSDTLCGVRVTYDGDAVDAGATFIYSLYHDWIYDYSIEGTCHLTDVLGLKAEYDGPGGGDLDDGFTLGAVVSLEDRLVFRAAYNLTARRIEFGARYDF